MSITQQQIDNVQIDYGIVFINYGVTGERKLAPTKGGGEFSAKAKMRDIEYDGARGKTKGMQVIEDIAATLNVTVLDTSMDNIALAMPYADYTNGVITAKGANIGMIANSAYLNNITMFCKTLGGKYKKITLYNAMSEGDFKFAAKPKGEGEIKLEIEAHWDALDDTSNLYSIEDINSITADLVKPTLITSPIDAATAIVVTSNLTAIISKDIKQSDINSDNFMLLKASDGTIIPGILTYNLATKTVLFVPTSNLATATSYIWMIARVTDTSGNIMLPVIVNFTTA
jgi:hypothetical protein